MRARTVVALSASLMVTVLAACGGGASSPPTATRPAPPAHTPSTGAAPWPAPPDPLARVRLAGLEPKNRELLAYHVHAHLDVFVNGKRVIVPAGIGINIKDPAVHSGTEAGGPAYGGIKKCAQPCISPLHTHDITGVLHTESARAHPNTLGEFFTEWAVRLDASCLGGYCRPDSIQIFVDGKRYTGNPAAIALTDRKEIAIVIGSPPTSVPSRYAPFFS